MISTINLRVEAAPKRPQSQPISLDPLIRMYFQQKLTNAQSDTMRLLGLKFTTAALIGSNTQVTLALTVNVSSTAVLEDLIRYITRKDNTDDFTIISIQMI